MKAAAASSMPMIIMYFRIIRSLRKGPIRRVYVKSPLPQAANATQDLCIYFRSTKHLPMCPGRANLPLYPQTLLVGTPCVLFPGKVWGGRRSWDALRWFPHQLFDVTLKPDASVRINCKILYHKILAS